MSDDLIAALDAATSGPSDGLKFDRLFGDRPDVKAAVSRNLERGLSVKRVAELLSQFLPEGQSIGEDAVRKWWNRQPKK